MARGEPVLQLAELDCLLHDAQAKNGELGVVGIELEADDACLFARNERDGEDGDGAKDATAPGAGEEEGGWLVCQGP